MGWVKDSYWRKDASLGRNIVKLPLKIIMLPVSSNHIGRCLQRFITSFNSEKTKNKGQMACVWHEPWVFDADLISDYVEVCFEGRKFPALKGYDAYLRGQYGDYMKLPPESQRVPKHDYIAYWKD